MARYLHGLNREIQDIVELHHYASLKDLIHQAIKVEQQVKRKQTYKKNRGSSLKSHEKVLPLVKIILTLLPLLQKRVPINVLSVWERVILSPNVLTKGEWLWWVMGLLLVHLFLALLVLLLIVKVNVMYNP